MSSDFSASAVSAGALFSNSRFLVPIYQREYSWTEEEVKDFWDDLRIAKAKESYFLGLIILTERDHVFEVVDGQQRILTLTLIAECLRSEAIRYKRAALADRIYSDFLRSINYKTDVMEPRVKLSGELDSDALAQIVSEEEGLLSSDIKGKLASSFQNLKKWLSSDISRDPFKGLGEWADFISNRVSFAVFTHPNPASAYRVFEAINTRGRDLTTADLLKSFIISQTAEHQQRSVYERWQRIAQQFDSDSGASFVQYIRHVVTVRAGHILPKELYDYIGRRLSQGRPDAPAPLELISELEDRLPLYTQMIDPSIGGPADEELLGVFHALNQLSVVSVRPILLALFETKNPIEGAKDLLRLVVRRIVVGNLGTGNVERKFGDAAKILQSTGSWHQAWKTLEDLNPVREDFSSQLKKRSFNKSVLAFLRKSIVLKTITPRSEDYLHLIRIKSAANWGGFDDDELRYWINTIGNTVLLKVENRDKGIEDWSSFKQLAIAQAADGECVDELRAVFYWDARSVEEQGQKMAAKATEVWYD